MHAQEIIKFYCLIYAKSLVAKKEKKNDGRDDCIFFFLIGVMHFIAYLVHDLRVED